MKCTSVFLAAALALFGIGSFFHLPKPKPQALFQQKTSHMLTFLDEEGERGALCTGTVIGPHAILTAEHCDEPAKGHLEFQTLNIDLSTRNYTIGAVTFDQHDHEILIVDGPPFATIEPYVVRKPVAGEQAFFYGFGKEDYPAHESIGKVKANDDPSDVDEAQKVVYFSNQAIPGDSGSALYGKDGAILALVTWSIDGKSCAGFQLAFTDEVIKISQTFGAGETL